ncbi:MAG: biopolymer transporter ExbD [Firmicutes bacterium]|jgi:biopolymer transport protein ExbD|nr:biopolymer transporter ExbD [Bacillota bacterium]
MMAIRRRNVRKPFVQIVSLLDVFVILLFYFMLSTTFRSTPAGINLILPRATTGVVQTARDLTVTIDAQGRMYAAGQIALPADITRIARNHLADDPNLSVTIRADEAVRYESVVTAIDAVRAAGVHNLRLAVRLPSASAQ